jgi:pimeloyl-ACP methyl ester carboxylesterase
MLDRETGELVERLEHESGEARAFYAALAGAVPCRKRPECGSPLLVICGKYKSSFDSGEPERYRKDVPKAEIHVVDGGHFALDTAADRVGARIRRFFTRGLRGAAGEMKPL